MKSKFVNLSGIFKEYFALLKKDKVSNKVYFIVVPIVFGLLSLLIGDFEKVEDIISSALAIFIGLFLNLLVLIVTIYKREESKDLSMYEDERRRVLGVQETFHSISAVTIISVLSLVLLLFRSIEFNCIYVERLIRVLFSTSFTFIVMSILLIVKNIFNIYTERMNDHIEEMDERLNQAKEDEIDKGINDLN